MPDRTHVAVQDGSRATRRGRRFRRAQAARFLGCSASSLAHGVYDIPFERVANKVWYREQDLVAFLDQQRQLPARGPATRTLFRRATS